MYALKKRLSEQLSIGTVCVLLQSLSFPVQETTTTTTIRKIYNDIENGKSYRTILLKQLYDLDHVLMIMVNEDKDDDNVVDYVLYY